MAANTRGADSALIYENFKSYHFKSSILLYKRPNGRSSLGRRLPQVFYQNGGGGSGGTMVRRVYESSAPFVSRSAARFEFMEFRQIRAETVNVSNFLPISSSSVFISVTAT